MSEFLSYAYWEIEPYKRRNLNSAGSSTARYKCSHCGRRTGYQNYKSWNFCPNCGLRLVDKIEEEQT